MEGHRGPIRLRWKNFKSSVLPGFRVSVQLRPSLPFIASFLPLVSISPVFCPLTLSPSICERDPWQPVCPPSFLPFLSQLVSLPPSCPPSTRVSLVVCLSSVEVSFLSELRWKDCFSCVYTKTTRPPFSQNHPGLVRLCAAQQVPT